MDLCGHLMKQCHKTKEFTLPEPIAKIERENSKPLEFSQEENQINLKRCKKKKFYDQKICRHLCSSSLVLETTRTNPVLPCESICFQLTRSFDSAGEVCPRQKYCRNGCPCPFYDCEKIDDFHQKLIPVFDLLESRWVSTDSQKANTTDASLITFAAFGPPLNTDKNTEMRGSRKSTL